MTAAKVAPPVARPVLFVLAGVNGAGKSSIGGLQLRRLGLTWFNPDTFARELAIETGCAPATASAQAWAEGMRRLDEAMAHRCTFAFETTLGGTTVASKVQAAAQTHDVLIWFCGLATVEQHLARVRLRVAYGGHDIPEAKVRARYPRALANLIALMPCAAEIKVYDNSVDAAPGDTIPDPTLVLHLSRGEIAWPTDAEGMRLTPVWAKPLVEAALVYCSSTDTGS
jgi:predicted ABC-type ATPase